MHHSHHHLLNALSAETASKVAMEMCMKKNWPQLIYECFFNSSVSLSGVTHLTVRLPRRNITWIRGMFAIGWNHKLSFIMPHNSFFFIHQHKALFFRWSTRNFYRTFNASEQQRNHSYCLHLQSHRLLISSILKQLVIEVVFKSSYLNLVVNDWKF